jgi:peptidoglycan/xylan/chitin deacetylase (PgdA/CDA1 family)
VVALSLLLSLPALADFDQDLLRGCNALAGGDIREASQYFQRALAARPTDPAAHLGLGIVYLHAGSDWGTHASLEFGAAGGSPEALAGLGYVELARGHYATADALFADAMAVGGPSAAPLVACRYYAALCAGDAAALRDSTAALPQSGADAAIVQALDADRNALLGDAQEGAARARAALARLQATPTAGLGAIRLNSPRVTRGGASALPRWGGGSPPAQSGPLIAAPGSGAKVAGLTAVHVVVPKGGAGSNPYVSLAVDGQAIASTGSPPFRFQWDTTRVPPGSHTLAASLRSSPTDASAVTAQVSCEVIDQPVAPPKGRYHDECAARLGAMLSHPRVDESWRQGLTNLGAGSADVGPPVEASGWAPIRVGPGLPPGPGATAPPRAQQGPRIMLFLDDGPHPTVTPALLDILSAAGVKAAFFLVGTQCEKYPDLVRKIRAAGHTVGSHSYTHPPNLTNLYPAEVKEEIGASVAVIDNILSTSQGGDDYRVRFFRSPGGHVNAMVRLAIQQAGLTALDEGIYNTWGGMEKSPEDIVADAMANPHEVILLHNGEDKTVFILPMLLKALKGRGYQFATPDEVVARP